MIYEDSLKTLEQSFNVRILAADIIGSRRWAFKGKLSGDIPAGQSERILIRPDKGVIVYNWHTLTENSRQQLKQQLLQMNPDV